MKIRPRSSTLLILSCLPAAQAAAKQAVFKPGDGMSVNAGMEWAF